MPHPGPAWWSRSRPCTARSRSQRSSYKALLRASSWGADTKTRHNPSASESGRVHRRDCSLQFLPKSSQGAAELMTSHFEDFTVIAGPVTALRYEDGPCKGRSNTEPGNGTPRGASPEMRIGFSQAESYRVHHPLLAKKSIARQAPAHASLQLSSVMPPR